MTDVQLDGLVTKCHEDVPGTVPSWAGEDQIDSCTCVLDKHHEGNHKCEHMIEKEQNR